jgi:hypothetical protein
VNGKRLSIRNDLSATELRKRERLERDRAGGAFGRDGAAGVA